MSKHTNEPLRPLNYGQSIVYHWNNKPISGSNDDADTVSIRGNCVFTGQAYETKPLQTAYMLRGLELWQHNMHIQDALRLLSPDDQEFLISGVSPAGWTQTFGADPDEANANNELFRKSNMRDTDESASHGFHIPDLITTDMHDGSCQPTEPNFHIPDHELDTNGNN